MIQLGGAHCTTSQNMVSLSSPSSQLSTDAVFANGGSNLLTDDQICDLIADKIAKFRSGSANESGLSHEIGSLFQADCNVPSSSSEDVPRSSSSFKDCVHKQSLGSAVIQRYTPKAAQPPEDLLKIIRAELTSKKIKRKDYPHVQTEVAATNMTKEEKTPLVLTTVSAVTCPGLTHCCSLAQEELKSNKSLGHGVSVELVMQREEKNPDSLQDINSNNTEVKTTEDEHCYNTCKEKMFSCMSLKDLQSEDISDDEDKSKHLSSELCEDENQCIQSFAVEIPPHPELSEPNTGDYVTNISCAVFKDKQELNNQLDDSDDDDWKVIPITIFNLKFEEADDVECGGKTSSSFINERLGRPAPKPVPASAFSQMDVFDTPAQQELAVKFGQVSFVVPSSSSNHERKSHILGSRKELWSEAEDSCETDDSCDYSSGSESNYLTVSKQVVRNLSPSSQRNVVDSDSERKNQPNQAKKLQKSSNQDVIVCIDSEDESDDACVKETKSIKRSSPHSEISGSSPTHKLTRQCPEPLKSQGKNVENMPPDLDQQLKGGHIESAKLTRGTEKGLCVKNEVSRQTNVDDDIIIILSDSDDDGVEICDEAMTSFLNSAFLLKEHTADKDILQDLKQSSAESSEPRPESSCDEPGTSRLIAPAKVSFHEPSGEVKDLTKRKMSSSETENDDVDLNNAGNGLCTKTKKVKLSKASGSLRPSPVIRQLLVRLSPHSSEQLQLVHESTVQSHDNHLFASNSSTVSCHSQSFRKKSRHSIRDETGPKSKRTKQDHSTTRFKVNPASFRPKIHSSALKGQLPSTSCPPFPLKRSSQSVDRTNHARRKVFSDWQKNHVPLRRERKATQRGKLP